MRYRHIFFDLDGTLWDLQRNTRLALSELHAAFHSLFGNTEFEHFFRRYHVHNDALWARYRDNAITKEDLRVVRFRMAFEDCGLEVSPTEEEAFSDAFLDLCPRQPHLVEGALDLLEHVNGRYHLHIITNGFREVQGIKLKSSGIAHYFRSVVHSEEAGIRKPHKGIFEFAFRGAGADPRESLMIGDDWVADILGARDAGMDQVFLTTTERTLSEWKDEPRSLRHNHSPTHEVDDLRDLLPLL